MSKDKQILEDVIKQNLYGQQGEVLPEKVASAIKDFIRKKLDKLPEYEFMVDDYTYFRIGDVRQALLGEEK